MTPAEVLDADPCKCHRSFAYITPIHAGHCCFVPATQTCHAEEMGAWVDEKERRNAYAK